MNDLSFRMGNRIPGHPIPEVVLRTRRSVMEAAHQMQVTRQRRRRNLGIALLAMASLVVLFTPASWSAFGDIAVGEHFMDLPVMLLTLSMVLLSAMFAILLVSWRDARRNVRDE